MRIFPRLAVVCASLISLAAFAAPPPGYYQVWGDEFNGTSLDPTKWWVWNQPDRSGYSVPQAVTVGNGCMTIHTYSTNGQNYSGIVSSDERFRMRYGYCEASVEFNGAPGMFSDFWMNSSYNGLFLGDPAEEGAEVDMCEHRVTDASNADDISGQVTIDLHWNGYTKGIEQSFNSPLYGSGLGTGFHTYGLLWNSNGYNVSVDGTLTMTTNWGVSQRTEIILFSTEVDSNSFCGIVPPGGYGDFNDSTTSTVVDYFRFYAPTTTVYWLGSSSANWSDGGNWVSNMIPSMDSDAVFSYLSTGNFNVNLDTNVSLNSLSLQETPGVTISGNSLTLYGGGLDMLSAINTAVINSPVILAAGQPWGVASGLAVVVNGPVSGPGGMDVNGLGVVELQGPDTVSGTTTVNSGTLIVNNTMSGPVAVAGGVLGGAGSLSGAVTVNSGTLSGTETFSGPVVVGPGGVIAPGSPTGTMTINNSLTLQAGSAMLINLNKSAGTCGQIAGLAGISLGGTLVVTNVSGMLEPGDTFNIFSAGSVTGAFSRINPPTPGPGLVWDAAALAQGTLRVLSPSNGVITAQRAGAQVALSWPSVNLGWQLQAQTNPPGMGISSNWVNVPGSVLTNLLNMPIDTNAGSVFYRLTAATASTSVFGTHDVVVLEVGNGTIASSGAPGILLDFLPSGGANQLDISIPSAGASSLIFGGSSYDGAISLSADGKSIVIPGYNVALGSFSGTLDSSSTTGSTAVPRAVGVLHDDGTFSIAATTTKFSGSTIRSAVTDGAGNYWAGGGSSGIVYLGNNFSSATVASAPSATRDMSFFNGSIYFTETGSGLGAMEFSNAPVAAATPALVVNTAVTGSASSPKGLAFSANIAYVADNRTASSGGGVLRFNWNGNSWVYAYTLANNLTSSTVVDDLAVDFSGANPVLYAVSGETTGNHIIVATDTGAGSSWAKLAGATSGNAFRGIAMAPR